MSKSAIPPHDQEMTLVQHLLELRNAMTKGIIAVLVVFFILFPFANQLYTYISAPLTHFLPAGASMIATGVASPFLTPFKLSMVLAIYISMPILLYQVWKFVSPALYNHEKQLVAPILFFSSFLFYAGGAFAYYIVFPLVFGFLSTTAPAGVTIATDIALYLDFVIKMFFAFGIAFEVPVIVVIFILTGIVSPEKLTHARPYIIVAAFVIGMLLTPPDIVSQTMLAVPMWLLYETGVIVGAYVKKRRDKAKALREAKENADPSSEKTSNSDSTKTASTAASMAGADDTMEFDDRYAEQLDDDTDWDKAFDNIDSEFGILDQEYHKRQTQESEQHDNNHETENADSANSNSSENGSTDKTDEPKV